MKNNIGFGIMCFGDKEYYQGALEKVKKFRETGFKSYILTDDMDKFSETPFIDVDYLYYYRSIRSYHDKMWLVKEILKYHEIAILIDADTYISDYSFLNQLKTHKFQEGISYPDVLLNHPEKKHYVKEIDMSQREWRHYHDYAKSQLIDFGNLELMWEYFIVVNWAGKTTMNRFYQYYDKLQVAKEFGELKSDGVIGCGEGISIAVASKLSHIPCQRDLELYDIIKDSVSNRSRKFMRNDN